MSPRTASFFSNWWKGQEWSWHLICMVLWWLIAETVFWLCSIYTAAVSIKLIVYDTYGENYVVSLACFVMFIFWFKTLLKYNANEQDKLCDVVLQKQALYINLKSQKWLTTIIISPSNIKTSSREKVVRIIKYSWSPKGKCFDLYQILSTNFSRKCIEISWENLYMDIRVEIAFHTDWTLNQRLNIKTKPSDFCHFYFCSSQH